MLIMNHLFEKQAHSYICGLGAKGKKDTPGKYLANAVEEL